MEIVGKYVMFVFLNQQIMILNFLMDNLRQNYKGLEHGGERTALPVSDER